MFEKLSRSWELVKASYAVLRSDKELLLFPLMSMIGVILVTIVFAIPLFASGLVETVADETALTQGQEIMGFVITFLFYFCMYTIIIFSNVALVGAAMMRLRGEDPTVRDGMRIASERIWSILGYAAIASTVGMILNTLRNNRNNLLSRIVAMFLSTAWNLLVFLVIPVLVVENVGPVEAIKRSGTLLKQTWGEQVAGSFSIGIIFMLITFAALIVLGIPVFALVSASGSVFVTVIGVGFIVLVVMGINLFGTALNGIFQAALYRYATEGTAGELFPATMVEHAFERK